MTAKELYDEVFKDYEGSSENNRIRKIFDGDSELNQRLGEFGRRVKEYVPDLEEELKQLGFDGHLKIKLEDYMIPNYADYYYNDRGEVIQMVKYGETMIVGYKDWEMVFESKNLGEKERDFLRWAKEVVNE